MQSWVWPVRPECIAEVFLVRGWAKNVAQIDFNDLATALSLWNNCTEYNIQQNTIDKLRETRNSLFAHNVRVDVSDVKLTTTFNVLNALFHDNDLRNSIDVHKCLKELEDIQEKSYVEIYMYHKEFFDNLERKMKTQTDKLNQAILLFTQHTEACKPTEDEKKTRKRKQKGISSLYPYLKWVGVCFVAMVIFVLVRQQLERRFERKHELVTGN